MSHLDSTFAIVLAGGGGTRLWPKSREKTPKQFLKLLGSETMMQLTVNRINKLIPWERIIVVTNELYQKEVAKQLPKLPKTNIIAEPAKRDTALAMLAGAIVAKKHNPDAVVINCASDHIVHDDAEFLRVMTAASKVANEHKYLVSVGITPTRPATGFGYIRIGSDLGKIDTGLTLFKVESFTEKPNRATAQAFISTGRYFWNANMYVWSADNLITAFEKHMPEMMELVQPLLSGTIESFHKKLPAIYEAAPAIAIDYAISEKADNLTLIPGDFGWNDVGDWKVVHELGVKDQDNNVIISDQSTQQVLTHKSQNNLIHTNGKLIALAGVNDMVIVDTEEILMIVPKNESQDVKKLVERLKEEKKKQYL
ncbi:MAG: sugar phosphate nucleotidyltransferase [Patescibacteria group bacterium]